MGSNDNDMRQPGATEAGASGEPSRTWESARGATREVSARARALMEEGRGEAQSFLEEGKDEVARRMQNLARALRTTADNLREQDESALAQYTELAGRRAADVSGFLRDRRAADLIRQLEEAARRQPVLALGGALIAGVAAGRFLHPAPEEEPISPGGETAAQEPRGAPSRTSPAQPLGQRGGFGETTGAPSGTPGTRGGDGEGSPSKT